MTQNETRLCVADNSGAREILVIRVRAVKAPLHRVGDTITATAKTADPQGAVKKGEVVTAVVVPTKSPTAATTATTSRRRDAAVLIDAQNNPRGTRIFGPVARELRDATS